MNNPVIFESKGNLTLETLQAAIDTVIFKHGPAYRWPTRVNLSPANCHNLYQLPNTMACPRFETKTIDIMGIPVMESTILNDDEIVLIYGISPEVNIKLIKLTEPRAAGNIDE